MQTKNTHNKRIRIEELANKAWNFAYTLLWNNQEFNEAEIELATQLIQEYFSKSEKPLNTFIMFCERVQLAFQYIQRNPTRFVVHPLKWLSPHYEFGYKGTKKWYLDLVHERKYISIHRFELRVMAEAYLQFVLSPIAETYQTGRKAIMHYNKTDILQAYNNAILNFKYNN